MNKSDNRTDYLRFEVNSRHLRQRVAAVDSVLRRFSVVCATGSLIEAYLASTLGLSGALPNLVGCGINKAEVFDLCKRSNNILLILTESIAKDLGHELVDSIRAQYTKKIRILYVLQDRSLARRIKNINVDAIVLAASFDSGAIAKALALISAGKTYFDPDIIQAFQADINPHLTKREDQVLRLLEEGMSNKEIAKELFISPVTVRDYVECLMRKFDSNNRTLVVTKARNKGLL
jgi:DNA-binding NarL/FixJ family response regulator